MRVFVLLIFAALLVAGGVYYYQKDTQGLQTADLRIGDKQIEVEVADTLPKQIQGLAGRPSICFDCGMVFVYEKPQFLLFTMQGMRFPLDMVFVNEGRIVEIREGLRYPENGEAPLTINSSVESSMVLEVNEGFVYRNRLKVGDRVVLTRKN